MTSRDSRIDVKFRDKCKPSIRVYLVVQNRLLRETMTRLFQKKPGIIVVGKECSVTKLPESAGEPSDVLLMDSLKAGCAKDLEETTPPHQQLPKAIFFGMDDDPRNMPAILQPQIAPAAAAVITAPDTAQVLGDIVPQRALPFAGIDDAAVAWRHRYRADPAAEKPVADILPVAAPIGGLPQTAARRAEIKRIPVR